MKLFHFLLLPSPNILDQGTPLSQLVESMAHLKETQESQQKVFEELIQQMTSLASSYEGFVAMNSGMNVHDNPLFEGNGGSIQTCTAHLEFPKFNGTDPSGWIYKAQKFFLYYQTPPQHKLLISSIYMEGRALAWYMLMENSKELTSWEAFTRALEIRFGLSPYYYNPCYCDPVEALIKLTQTSSVEKFQSHFERLASRTKGLPAAFMISCFINGLREDIGVTVKMFKPTTLSSAFELARMQEEESMRIEGNTSNPAVTSKSYIPVQRISLAQMKERRDRGLEIGNQEEENDPGTETNFY